MELHTRQNSSGNLNVENASLDARSLTETEGLEKRSRFSLYSGGKCCYHCYNVMEAKTAICLIMIAN